MTTTPDPIPYLPSNIEEKDKPLYFGLVSSAMTLEGLERNFVTGGNKLVESAVGAGYQERALGVSIGVEMALAIVRETHSRTKAALRNIEDLGGQNTIEMLRDSLRVEREERGN